jgi:hypothetical protein
VAAHRGGGTGSRGGAGGDLSARAPGGGARSGGRSAQVAGACRAKSRRGPGHDFRGRYCRGRARCGGALHPGDGRRSRPQWGCCSDSWRRLMSCARAGARFGHVEGRQRPLLGSWWRGCTGKGGAAAGNNTEGLGWVL